MTLARLMARKEKQVQMPPASLDGYLTQMFEAGREPDYGYPKNGLPKTDGGEMQVVTGFLAVPAKSQE